MANRNFEVAPNRARFQFWGKNKQALTMFEKGPELGNNEYLQALNAAGTALVDMVKVDANDRVMSAEEIPVTWAILANGDLADMAFFIADAAYEVTAVREVHSTAGSDGSDVNLNVERLQGTEAPGGNGDALLTDNSDAGFDLKDTANTVQDGTLVTTAVKQLAVGDRLGLNFTGDLTAVAGLVVTVYLKRI
jgi:hypothetical protein